MTDRPIIFSAPMVRALLAGRKTQTRRVLKPQPPRGDHFGRDIMDWGLSGIYRDDLNTSPSRWWLDVQTDVDDNSHREIDVRYGAGDRLWAREAWSHDGAGVWTIADARTRISGKPFYRADDDRPGVGWWSSIFLPREFSRLTLIVTEVRVEQLNAISEADAIAEGVEPIVDHGVGNKHLHGIAYQQLWDRLYGAGAWLTNPWVAAVTFEVHRANIDALHAGRIAA